MHAAVRPPAVAGTFYPGDSTELATLLGRLLAEHPQDTAAPPPKAVIAPHAGYIYSGPTAAAVYARLAPLKGKIARVVLLGPTHRVPVRGLAVPSVDAFATPLGSVAIDKAARDALAGLPQVVVSDSPHAHEHSLEVQLPFLQAALGDFALLPLAVGHASPEDVAEVLERLWGGPETLIVVSSDLSHYLPYARAQRTDRGTCERILELAPRIVPEEACGAYPINGLLLAAQRRGLEPELVDLRNSGDTAGDKGRVVGYAAFAFREAPPDPDAALGRALVAIAESAIAARLGEALSGAARHDLPALAAPGATFVTLTIAGALRGCIGSLEAERPLAEDVRANAVAAAFADPRFPPLTGREWPETRVEVSLLTPAQPMRVIDEADAMAQLRPGVDGIILSAGARRATFLPQVWEQLPEPLRFLQHLKMKAGLAADFWGPELKLARYEVKKWKGHPRHPAA